ncbi:DUF2182 domain-containing protein [Billgrantia kenyensis]
MSAAVGRQPGWLSMPVLVGLIGLAWLLAIVAELTGKVQWVHHHQLVVDDMALWFSLILFLLAWQLHIAAMMLPSALPMVGLFRQAAAGQPNPGLVQACFLGGYLVVWTLFGVLALLADTLLGASASSWHWLMHRPEWLMGGALLLAGGFQFTSLKSRCLDKCRQPRAFLLAHYRRGLGGATALGVRHGMFCVGCCWALMLVMFVVGIANLAWMAPLAALMIYEKVGRHGERVVRPAGVGLLLLGLFFILGPGWMSAPSHMH